MNLSSYRIELFLLFLALLLSAVFLGPKALLVHGLAPDWIPKTFRDAIRAEFLGSQKPRSADTSPLAQSSSAPPSLSEASSSLKFEGILYEAHGASQVLIHGEILTEGSLIGGWTVEKIFPSYALLSRNGKKWKISSEGFTPSIEEESPGTTSV